MNSDQDTFLLLDAAIPEQRAQWLDLWHTWPHRDVVAHAAYAQLLARPEDGVVCACQTGTEGGIIFPLIVRPLRIEPWAVDECATCDLVSPYGYGGPFGWGSFKVEDFWKGFDRWAGAIRAVSLFTRFSLFKDQLIPFFGDTVVKGPGVIVSLTPEPDAILGSYAKTIRENMRQAERAGVTLEPDPECQRLDEFFAVYYSAMNRLGARPMYYIQKSIIEPLIAQLPAHVKLFHAIHNQQVVSSELLLVSERYLYPFLAGTTHAGLELRANPLLRHGVHLWGKALGKQQIVLGGGYSGEDSLLLYKQRFAPNGRVPFCVGTRILDDDTYQTLIGKRATWEREQGNQWSPARDYFPAYRG